jgi:hypothetical protein
MVFPDEEMYDYEHYINGINKEQLVSLAIYLASYSEHSSNLPELNLVFFVEWFGSENIEYAKFINSRVNNLSVNGKGRTSKDNYRYTLFNPVSALKLIENILSREISDQSGSVDLTDINIRMFKFILRFNTDQNKTINAKIPFNSKEVEDVELAYYLTLTLANHEIINTNLSTLVYAFITQLSKSFYLFSYLNEYKPELLQDFLKLYGCKTTSDYYSFFSLIINIVLTDSNKNKESSQAIKRFEIDDKDLLFKNFVDRFLIKLKLDVSDLNEKTDFQYLRSSPIIKYKDGVYCIINSLFVIQKLYNGLYFELSDLYKRSQFANKESFRSLYTYNFTEKFLLYRVLKEIYQKRGYKQFSGDDISMKFNFKGGPDYYIRNGRNIFLFENKDNFINGQIKTSYDYFAIKDEIDKKLVEKKGIPQIINNIRFVLDKKFNFDLNYKTNSCIIYPIIVTHKNEFDAYGMNVYLNAQFERQLQKLKDDGYDISNVKRLTVINIDVLLLNKFALEHNRVILNDVINRYHNFIKPLKIRIKHISELEGKTQEMLMPFSEYVLTKYTENNIDYKDEMYRWLDKLKL